MPRQPPRRRRRSVISSARRSRSAASQSNQIQTLAKQVNKLKKISARSKQSVMTIARMEGTNLARSFTPLTGVEAERDKAWVMPIVYAPAVPLDNIAVPQNTTAACNNPLRTPAGDIVTANTINKAQLFGSDYNAQNVLGITHKGGTLRLRVTCTFKQPTSLHFFLVRPSKDIIADNLMRDIGYLDPTPVVASSFPLRGAGVTLREDVDYTYGATSGTTPGIVDAKYRTMNPNVAFMNLKNWDIISKRVCNFDSQAQSSLLTTPPNLNTAADPDNNCLYKNISFKVPGAGYIKRNTTAANESLGTLESYGVLDQQNEKNVFLICLRTLRNGGPAPSSNPNEYCTMTLTQLDKYTVYT